MPSFRASAVPVDASSTRLVLAGEIDLANADAVVEVGTRCLRESSLRELVIDLGGVTFMDSTALSALVRLRNAAIEAHRSMTLDNVPDRVARLLEMTGLSGVLEVRPAAGPGAGPALDDDAGRQADRDERSL